MNDDQFNKLLACLGYSWAGYRKVRKGVKKRICRHMQRLGCRDFNVYLSLMERLSDIRYECELLMTVSISRFFRDRRLWEMLEARWLPDIITGNPLKLSVWSAGCAGGEEVYSFKIVWERLKSRFDSLPALIILATDRHPEYLERARRGIFNRSSLREMTANERIDFFESHHGAKQFSVKNQLKSDIRWQIGNLLTEPPEAVFQVIFMRNNILTYYRQEDQDSALNTVLKRLAPGGILIIGCHEALPFATGELAQMAACRFVYRKQPALRAGYPA
jgi:chemotaxis methyl-accepting protein methylase